MQTIDEATALADSRDVLSADEQAQADRFHFGRDRTRFIARRTFLRNVLATYTGLAARDIRYQALPEGKPELDPPGDIFFNTSHSDGLAVVAIARLPNLGVDVERIRPMPDALDLAHRYFSPKEHEIIRSTADPSRPETFLTLWTRKESYVKALGGGLSIPLTGFDVSTQESDRTGRVGGPDGDLPFVFASLDVPLGFVGAVTIAATQIALRNMATPS